MQESMEVAERASSDIETWLNSLNKTQNVTNVEDEPEYQDIDVDLLWETQKNEYQVEIKGDRQHETGNYFFETISNKGKNTPGCFMYSEADLLLYYFVDIKKLYILPLKETRKWFIENIDQFQERETTTPCGDDDYYITVGRLVPIDTVLKSISGIKKYNLKKIISDNNE